MKQTFIEASKDVDKPLKAKIDISLCTTMYDNVMYIDTTENSFNMSTIVLHSYHNV